MTKNHPRSSGRRDAMAMKYFDIPPGMKVYTLDICEALKGDHDLCPDSPR
jgi:hypothetical protein